jgi:hypothetical protein
MKKKHLISSTLIFFIYSLSAITTAYNSNESNASGVHAPDLLGRHSKSPYAVDIPYEEVSDFIDSFIDSLINLFDGIPLFGSILVSILEFLRNFKFIIAFGVTLILLVPFFLNLLYSSLVFIVNNFWGIVGLMEIYAIMQALNTPTFSESFKSLLNTNKTFFSLLFNLVLIITNIAWRIVKGTFELITRVIQNFPLT